MAPPRARVRVLLLTLFAVLPIVRADDILFGANFHGTLGIGMPAAVQFPTSGASATDAVQFHIGPVGSGWGDLEAGGIYRNIFVPDGPISLFAGLAVKGATTANLFGGMAQLLVNSRPLAVYDFGSVQAGEIVAANLQYQFDGKTPDHTVGIEWLRPATSGETPYRYIENFYANGYRWQSAPEPSTIILFAFGLAYLGLRARKKLS